MEMSFENKFTQCIRNLDNIDKPDCSRDDINLYADFVELLVVFTNCVGIGYGDIQDRFFGEPDENNSTERNDSHEAFIDTIFTLIEERISLFRDLYPFEIGTERILTLRNSLSLSQKLYLFLKHSF